ncbi:MAG: response regulator [Methyloligellaceae bacterium]
MTSHRTIIVDDHPLFRDALRQALTGCFKDLVISEAASLSELSEILEQDAEIDLVLLDLKMPGVKGFAGLMYLRAQFPEIPVVVVSSTEDLVTISRCIELGASGYIPKSQPVEAIRNAVKVVFDGGVWTPPDLDLAGAEGDETSELVARLATLTPQQVRVLMMLGEGLLNKQIAYQLGVSEATVKAHVSAILQKLGVDSRTQAVIAMGKIEGNQWRSQAG